MEFKGNSFIKYPFVFKEDKKGKGKPEREEEKYNKSKIHSANKSSTCCVLILFKIEKRQKNTERERIQKNRKDEAKKEKEFVCQNIRS